MSFKHVIDGIVDAAKQMDEAAKTDLATQLADAAKALVPEKAEPEKGDPADAGAKGEEAEEKATGGAGGGAAGADGEKPEDEEGMDGEKSKTSKAATMPWPLDIND